VVTVSKTLSMLAALGSRWTLPFYRLFPSSFSTMSCTCTAPVTAPRIAHCAISRALLKSGEVSPSRELLNASKTVQGPDAKDPKPSENHVVNPVLAEY